MRAGVAPLRFVVVAVGLWIGGRVLVLAEWPSFRPVVLQKRADSPVPVLARTVAASPSRPALPEIAQAMLQPVARPAERLTVMRPQAIAAPLVPHAASGETPGRHVDPRVSLILSPPPDGISPRQPSASRWTGEAYLFVRSGKGRPSLAAGGQLGASQAAVRITYALDRSFSLAARAYAPLDTPGASEGVLGVDWHPLPAVPVRVSVERRFAARGDGRDAWSAYGAGGFYKSGLPGGVEADGYAQAGIVGVRRRDLFADAALRLAKPIALDERHVVRLGAASWGAAQPGATRLDLGPRAALSLPLGPATVTAAVDYRMRVAGDARPGSGAAFTLSAGF